MTRLILAALAAAVGIGVAVWHSAARAQDYEAKHSDFVQIVPAEGAAREKGALAEVIYSNGVSQGSVAYTYRVELTVRDGDGERLVQAAVRVVPNKPEPGTGTSPERYMGREYAEISLSDPALMALPWEGWVSDGEFLRFVIVPGLM